MERLAVEGARLARKRMDIALEVPDDLYWFVPADQLHDPTREPTALTLGSLADDWAEVAAVADGRKDPIGYVLVWASAVLRAVGDRTP